jgi:hypothetical protein
MTISELRTFIDADEPIVILVNDTGELVNINEDDEDMIDVISIAAVDFHGQAAIKLTVDNWLKD